MILALLACGGGVPEGSLELREVAEVPLVDDVGSAGRPRRRMNVDQLSDAIEHVTGYAWVEADQRLFDRLSGTLGKPEFLDSTEEDLAPGLLFQKFLDDAAKQTCRRRASDDGVLPVEQRVLVTPADPHADPGLDPEATRATLKRALLRFHGRTLADDDPDLARWEWLVNTAYARTGTGIVAWRAVCVGLITHPDFYSY
ncbi:MAG: hypothetical protein H6734_04555 [Alphaproteobacteria bacterium]|nr:hypothetical protein [Alphaproteobacteria bacterium]